MARALPKEFREKVVKAYERNVGTINEVASIFDLSPRTVAKYLHLYRVEGNLTPKPHTGRIPILTAERLEIVKNIVLSNNDGTLQDYADSFKEQTGIEVTFVTIHNACKKLDLRRKKRVFTPKKGNEQMSKIRE
jgi:transposase